MNVCTIAGCGKPQRARGWCVTHYWRWSKHGDPLKLIQAPMPTICEAPDCEKAPSRGRYCVTHWARKTRLGSFDLPERRDRRTHSMGYQIVKRPEHALADPKGWVYEHRAVLHDAIGPGWHPCHRCGMQVCWELTYPEAPDALVVDHLDEDKANNDSANLVPSCAPCNFQRSSRWVKQRRREATR